jgi:hypothetical protein
MISICYWGFTKICGHILTTGDPEDTKCWKHSAKGKKYSAKVSPSVTLGELHSLIKDSANTPSQSVFHHAPGEASRVHIFDTRQTLLENIKKSPSGSSSLTPRPAPSPRRHHHAVASTREMRLGSGWSHHHCHHDVVATATVPRHSEES